MYAAEAIAKAMNGDESAAFAEFEHRVMNGVEAWYRLIALFYKLQNLFTYFAVHHASREKVVRILQGNLYEPASLQRAREMIALMESAHERVMNNPESLLRPGALSPAAV